MTGALASLALGVLASGLLAVGSAHAQQDPRRSGYDDMSSATQAMQRDDTQNPAMLFVADGEALWKRPAGSDAKTCASCHGDARTGMRGVAARYPAFYGSLARPVTLGERLNLCRTRQQRAEAWRAESAELLALEAYVALQSRGQVITPPDDTRLAPFRARGEQRYRQRIGQLDVHAKVVRIEFELVVVGTQTGVLLDIHGQRGDRPLEGQLPVLVLSGRCFERHG